MPRTKKSEEPVYCFWKTYCNLPEHQYACCYQCENRKRCKQPCKCIDDFKTCTYKTNINKEIIKPSKKA